MRVLAADIGGTKCLVALARVEPDGVHLEHARRYQSADLDGVGGLVDCFLRDTGVRLADVGACGLAVAGPVIDGRARLTNLGWVVDPAALGLPATSVLNDFVAVAWGVGLVAAEGRVTLQAGDGAARGPVAVLGAGTGLGEALVFEGAVLATEGGHCDFAPQSDDQDALARWMRGRLGHVSYERIVSGPGLVSVHEFFAERAHQPPLATPAEVVAASRGGDSVARQAVGLFVEVYGAEAGNLALKGLATGGVYLAGGLTGHLLPELLSGAFTRAFVDKGRFEPLLRAVRVTALTDERVGLLGAALRAQMVKDATTCGS